MSDEKEPTSGSPAKEMPRRQTLPEIQAMSKCDAILSQLTPSERARVIAWIATREAMTGGDVDVVITKRNPTQAA